jgi:high-affinity Fe2+/Pb2+ permease
MKLFREDLEERQERNRTRRFASWRGIILYIVIFVLIVYILRNFNSERAEYMLWFMRGGR